MKKILLANLVAAISIYTSFAEPGGSYILTGNEKSIEEIVKADMAQCPELYKGETFKGYLSKFKAENKIGRRRFKPGDQLRFPETVASLRQASERPTPTQVQGTGFINYHVHLSKSFSVAQAEKLSKASGIRFGIVEHPGRGYKITDDRALDQYIRMLEPYPVYKGLQPVYTDWAEDFSKAMLGKLDFVLMDALTIPNQDGTWMRIWRPDTVIQDPQDFMERYVDFCLHIINNEPIEIFACPTYLPKCIRDQYDHLWTDDLMQKIITAAANQNIAIEINGKEKVPSARFIKMAKSAGVKFTFGTNSRGPDAANLDYCLKMVELCSLTDRDMFELESMPP